MKYVFTVLHSVLFIHLSSDWPFVIRRWTWWWCCPSSWVGRLFSSSRHFYILDGVVCHTQFEWVNRWKSNSNSPRNLFKCSLFDTGLLLIYLFRFVPYNSQFLSMSASCVSPTLTRRNIKTDINLLHFFVAFSFSSRGHSHVAKDGRTHTCVVVQLTLSVHTRQLVHLLSQTKHLKGKHGFLCVMFNLSLFA